MIPMTEKQNFKLGNQYEKIEHPKYKYKMLRSCYYLGNNIDGVTCEEKLFTIRNGCITVKAGYSWDGPSGPTHDDETNIRASLFHDIWYQALNEGLIPRNFWTRRAGDKMFLRILKEDGMSLFRRTGYFYAVRGFGALFAYL